QLRSGLARRRRRKGGQGPPRQRRLPGRARRGGTARGRAGLPPTLGPDRAGPHRRRSARGLHHGRAFPARHGAVTRGELGVAGAKPAGDLRATVALAALALALYPSAVFRGRAFYERDVHLVWHPQVEAFVRSIAAGSWPVWDPFVSFGQPLLANPHAQVLYPFTWLNLVLPPWTVYTLFVVAHTAFAGAGLYFLARHLGLSRPGALTAAAAWMASGPFLSLANMWIQLGGASWIPWVFLATSRALATRRAAHAVLAGGAMALQLFAGSPDMTLLTVGTVAAWSLWSVRPRARGAPPELGGLATTAAAGLFTLALSAGLWLPALD